MATKNQNLKIVVTGDISDIDAKVETLLDSLGIYNLTVAKSLKKLSKDGTEVLNTLILKGKDLAKLQKTFAFDGGSVLAEHPEKDQLADARKLAKAKTEIHKLLSKTLFKIESKRLTNGKLHSAAIIEDHKLTASKLLENERKIAKAKVKVHTLFSNVLRKLEQKKLAEGKLHSAAIIEDHKVTNAKILADAKKLAAKKKELLKSRIAKVEIGDSSKLETTKRQVNAEIEAIKHGANSIEAIRVKSANRLKLLEINQQKDLQAIRNRFVSGDIGSTEQARERNKVLAEYKKNVLDTARQLDAANKRSARQLEINKAHGRAIIEDRKRSAALALKEANNQKKITNEVGQTKKGIHSLVDANKGFLSHIFRIVAGYRLVNSVINNIQQAILNIPAAGIREQSAIAGLTGILGSDGAVTQLQFVKDLAQEAGQNISAMEESYKNFASSALLAGASQKVTNKVFEDFVKVGTVLHKTPDQMRSIFVALDQMFSKNTVQAEEAKRQLANQLPAAVEIFALAIGKTPRAFFDAMRRNEVIAKTEVPKFAKLLKDIFAGEDDAAFLLVSQQFQASLERTKNEYEFLSRDIFKNSREILNKGLSIVTEGLKFMRENLLGLIETVKIFTVLLIGRTSIALTTTALLTARATIANLAFAKSHQLVGLTTVVSTGKFLGWGATLKNVGAALGRFIFLITGLAPAVALPAIAITGLGAGLLKLSGISANYGKKNIELGDSLKSSISGMTKSKEEAEKLTQALTTAEIASNGFLISYKKQQVDLFQFLQSMGAVARGNIANSFSQFINVSSTAIVSTIAFLSRFMKKAAELYQATIGIYVDATISWAKETGKWIDLLLEKLPKVADLLSFGKLIKEVDFSQFFNLDIEKREAEIKRLEGLMVKLSKEGEEAAKNLGGGLKRGMEAGTKAVQEELANTQKVFSDTIDAIAGTLEVLADSTYADAFEKDQQRMTDSLKKLLTTMQAQSALDKLNADAERIKAENDAKAIEGIGTKTEKQLSYNDALTQTANLLDKINGTTGGIEFDTQAINFDVKNADTKKALDLALSLNKEGAKAAVLDFNRVRASTKIHESLRKQQQENAGIIAQQEFLNIQTNVGQVSTKEHFENSIILQEEYFQGLAARHDLIEIGLELNNKDKLLLEDKVRLQRELLDLTVTETANRINEETKSSNPILASIQPLDPTETVQNSANLKLEEEKAIAAEQLILDKASQANRLEAEKRYSENVAKIRKDSARAGLNNVTNYTTGVLGVIENNLLEATKASVAYYGAESEEAKKAFATYKAIAIAKTVIATAQAVVNALATSANIYVGIALAAVAGAMGALQIATIQGQQMPSAHGGLDFVPKEETYLLDRGERVLSPNQNKDFTNLLKNRQKNSTFNNQAKSEIKIGAIEVNVIADPDASPKEQGEVIGGVVEQKLATMMDSRISEAQRDGNQLNRNSSLEVF